MGELVHVAAPVALADVLLLLLLLLM